MEVVRESYYEEGMYKTRTHRLSPGVKLTNALPAVSEDMWYTGHIIKLLSSETEYAFKTDMIVSIIDGNEMGEEVSRWHVFKANIILYMFYAQGVVNRYNCDEGTFWYGK